MAQKTKKSPTPPTAKKTGAGLPKDSPKGTPSSLPPSDFSRLVERRGVDPRFSEEILRRAASAGALEDLDEELLANRRTHGCAKARTAGTSESRPATTAAPVPPPFPARVAEAVAAKVEERHRRALEFEAACSQAFSREGAYREEDPARGEHRFVCLTCGLVTDLEHDDCRAVADRFAGAPTLSAVAEIAKATDQEPEDIVRTFVELGLRVLGRGDRNAYFDARRLWEILNYGGEVM